MLPAHAAAPSCRLGDPARRLAADGATWRLVSTCANVGPGRGIRQRSSMRRSSYRGAGQLAEVEGSWTKGRNGVLTSLQGVQRKTSAIDRQLRERSVRSGRV